MGRLTPHRGRLSSSAPRNRGSSRCCCRGTVPVVWRRLLTNAGLDRATSEWLGFVDGDDYVEPTMFERLVDAAARCDADLAICEYQEVVDGSGERRDPADAHRWAELTASYYHLDVRAR